MFAASFTLSDARSVAGLPSVGTTARELGSLVDKSLIVFDPSSGLYRLLETVRSFAMTRLVEAGETDAVLARLHDHLLTVAPGPWSCWLNMRSGADAAIDVDNARRVLEWCAASGRPEAAAWAVAANLLPWFVTGRTQEALRWVRMPAPLDEALTLDQRLACRVAASWLAIAAMDSDGVLAIDAHLALAPSNHPAQVPLQFLKAWTLDRTDREKCRSLLASIRRQRPDDDRWQRQCDAIEGLTLLLDDQPAEATAYFSQPRKVNARPPRASLLFLAIANHLLGRHDEVTAIVEEVNTELATTVRTSPICSPVWWSSWTPLDATTCGRRVAP